MLALALAFLQDTTTPDPSQHISNSMAGLGAGLILFFILFAFAVLGFLVYCLWRIFTKAGLAGPLAFLIFIPGVGGLVVLCVLAFADWKVAPVPQYTAVPPVYPPPSFPTQPPAA